ncbi:hypothetical protein M2444_005344 [Paenibacillus sp. PastF-3]|uniref:hypothetical protein n=1 Tax=Paenibacillus sp. PastF-3 TaxID=2940626 RepID=UPI0024738C66|nr:hypothetical protein [Paenibacillus sp. PastF-3]MDH6373512.1 hypothetical protein [Paenibacillus sp. PastF-3]
MVIIKKLELALDLTRPAEELVEAIVTVLEFYPGRQFEILQQVDHIVGEMLAALQPMVGEESEPEAKENDDIP